jgi:two-component system NtrC family sensor kinase
MVRFQDTREGHWFDTRFFPIIDMKGEVYQIAVYIRDITEEKRMQDQNIEQQKLASLGKISAVIAHELNTPLATINLTAQMLQDTVGRAVAADIKTIENEAKRATMLVDEILGFSSIGSMTFDHIQVKEPLEIALRRQQQLHDTDHITFDVALDMGVVLADADKLAIAFENIIKNAILARHSPDKPHTVRIHEGGDDDNVVITVQDTGIGIDEENLSKIFQPFFTTRERGSGSGLGLYITEWIINSHDGHIGIESTKGKGTTITITISRSKPSEP